MDRRNRRHVFVTCVMGILIVAGLTSLGAWQLQRREWKQDLIAQRLAVWNMPPVDLNDAMATDKPLESFVGRRVTLKGEFVASRAARFSTLFLLGKTYHGRAGVHAITAFRLANNNDVILVDRGWVPIAASQDGEPSHDNLMPYPPGQRFLTGIVRPSGKPSSFTPDNDAQKGQWYWMDTAAMTHSLDMPTGIVTSIYLELTEPALDSATYENQPVIPIPVKESPDDIPNDHLQYALTWFALALITGGMTVLYLRKLRRS